MAADPDSLLRRVFSAGGISTNALSLKLSPAESGLGYLALFNAMTGPVTACGAITGGMLAGWLPLPPAPPTAGGLQIVFALSASLRLGSVLLLFQVVEEHAHPGRLHIQDIG